MKEPRCTGPWYDPATGITHPRTVLRSEVPEVKSDIYSFARRYKTQVPSKTKTKESFALEHSHAKVASPYESETNYTTIIQAIIKEDSK